MGNTESQSKQINETPLVSFLGKIFDPKTEQNNATSLVPNVENTESQPKQKCTNKINNTIINSDEFNNVFRIYTDVTSDKGSTKGANYIWKDGEVINKINNANTHISKQTGYNNTTNYLNPDYPLVFNKELGFNVNNLPTIGTRPAGITREFDKPQKKYYDAVFFVTGTPTKLSGNSGNRVHQRQDTGGTDSEGDNEGNIPPVSSRYIPTEIKMYLFDKNKNLVGIKEFENYDIKYCSNYGGYDDEGWVYFNAGSIDRPHGYKEGDTNGWCNQNSFGNINFKILIPYSIEDNNTLTFNDSKTIYYKNKKNDTYILNSQLELKSLKDCGLITNHHQTYGGSGGWDKNDNIVGCDLHWIVDNSQKFIKGLYDGGEPKEQKYDYNGGSVLYYGTPKTIYDAYYTIPNEYLERIYYSGNVCSRFPLECCPENQKTEENLKKCATAAQTTSNIKDTNARCFVVPKDKLTVSVIDDRFDYLLLQWLNTNKTGLTRKLMNELYNLFLRRPHLLMAYRIYKNYVGCNFKDYFNIENFLGPPMMYVNPGLKITDYSNYFASDISDQNIYKQITLKNDTTTEIKRKFISNLINKTAVLDKMFYSFINTTSYIKQPTDILSDAKFYVCFNIYMNYSDLMMYTEAEPSINFNYNLTPTILYSLSEDKLNTNFAFIYTNDDGTGKDSPFSQQSQLYLQCGKYNTPYVFNTTTKFEYNTKKIYLYFYHKDQTETTETNIQDANIHMITNIPNDSTIGSSNQNNSPYVAINAAPNIMNSYNQGYLKINDHFNYNTVTINTNIGYKTEKTND